MGRCLLGGCAGWWLVAGVFAAGCTGEIGRVNTGFEATGFEDLGQDVSDGSVLDFGLPPDAGIDVGGDDGASPDLPDDGPTPDIAPDDAPTPDIAPPDVPVQDVPVQDDGGPVGPGATPLTIRENRPHVTVTALGAAPIDFLIDTGSPLTALDTDHFGGGAGKLDTDIACFGQSKNIEVARYQLFGQVPDGATQVVAGILGAGYFFGDVLTIDYQQSVGYLHGDASQLGAIPANVAAATAIPFQRLGGGSFQIPGDGSLSTPATRLIVQGELEGTPVTMLVDTGAAYTVIKPSLFNSLPMAGRPTLDGFRIVQSGQSLEATMTRASSMSVGGVPVNNTPMVVVTNSILNSLSSETGANIEMFVGGTWLRHFLTTLNFDDDTLVVAEYNDPSHINVNEWIGPGLRFNDGPGSDFLVYDVYDATDAQAQGIQVDWRLAEFNGQPTSNWPTVEAFRDHLSTFAPGTDATFGFRDAGDPATIVTYTIEIENLLPAF